MFIGCNASLCFVRSMVARSWRWCINTAVEDFLQCAWLWKSRWKETVVENMITQRLNRSFIKIQIRCVKLLKTLYYLTSHSLWLDCLVKVCSKMPQLYILHYNCCYCVAFSWFMVNF